MATIYEVSKLAGVSLATVSRVMNKNANVSDKTKAKVLAAMAELGYRPNTIAQSLASNRSNSIGLVISELHGPFYGPLMAGVENECRQHGKHVIIAAGHSDEAKEKDSIEFLINRSCDALILHVEAVSDDYLRELSQGPTPIVLINRYVQGLSGPCITLDNRLGGYLATKHLLELGHRQFAYISGPLWKQDAQERLAGHQQALAEYSLPFNQQSLFEGDYQETGGSEGLAALLAMRIPFTALVCANDEMASGALTVAREQALQVPQQLSIIGFDNVLLTRYLFPKLSTVNYPINDMGRMAVRYIIKQVYQQYQGPLSNLFTPELVARDSTLTLP